MSDPSELGAASQADVASTDPRGPLAERTRVRDKLARLRRLAIKELREILRDRRTIVTLVLMPLLLYPLLSLACRQFLLAEALRTGPQEYRIGVMTIEEARFVQDCLNIGSDKDPLHRLQRTREDSATESLDEPRPVGFVVMVGDLDRAVRDYQVNLGVRFHDFRTPDWSGRQPVELDADLVLVKGSVLGARAAEFLESQFVEANDRGLVIMLRHRGLNQTRAPVQTKRQELIDPDLQSGLSLVTLTPLILILMTITGAVYPAIDLTAGERERGTLEVLMAAPVPRLGLLLAKYAAVVIVACMTAAVNLVMMAATVYLGGLAPRLFGEQGLTLLTVAQVFALLLLFSLFFSSLLLAIASFARSFKEAQAYLVPLMLASITPGLLSIMPGLKLTGLLTIAPLINIVLLSRDLFEHTADGAVALVVVVSTLLYAMGAIALAARVFGAEAVLYSARSGWADFFQRPRQSRALPSASAALLCLALLFPAHFVVINTIAGWGRLPIAERMLAASLGTALLFGVLPLLAARQGRVRLRSGFGLRLPPFFSLPGAVLLGLSLWMLAHEVVVFEGELGIASFSKEHFERVQGLLAQWRQLPLWAVLLTMSFVPALFEELFFRGYLLGALLSRAHSQAAIWGSACLFGAFHVVAADAFTIERFLPSMLLGAVLGWVRVKSGSVLPGVLLHACHNGLLVGVAYDEKLLSRITARFAELNMRYDEQSHLPITWLLAGGVVALAGSGLIWFSRRRQPPLDDGSAR